MMRTIESAKGNKETKETDKKRGITLDLPISDKRVNELLAECIRPDKKIRSELVLPADLNKPDVYKRFNHQEKKQQFREKLIQCLYLRWNAISGNEESANELRNQFTAMTRRVDNEGAIIIGDLIQRSSFQKLVEAYDALLAAHGNDSWIHSYVNLGNHPQYLTNPEFNNAFLHPLLIALIAYYVGGPIRIVDARAKDAKPLSVKAQDNMLHIDNTPFNDEFKVIVTWERSKASGPKGQYFVFIPGTHKAVRQCFVNQEGEAWSSENGSIFIRPEEVQNVFDIQSQLLDGAESPTVVETKHDEKPLTTVFAAGSLVHHRYRTEEGPSRSCMILAFHRTEDNPGQFMEQSTVNEHTKENGVNRLLFGKSELNSEDAFLQAIASDSSNIADKINEIVDESKSTEAINHLSRALTPEKLMRWKEHVTAAPTVEDKKKNELNFPLGQELNEDACVNFVACKLMMFDKHGPLDLILYANAHEEIRKWARNRIREIKQAQLHSRLISRWKSVCIESLRETGLLSLKQICDSTKALVDYIDQLSPEAKRAGKLPDSETISSVDALRSLRQLILDLRESVVRCETRQTFLSTILFIFWTVDELLELHPGSIDAIGSIGGIFLKNYITTATLIEKQILQEQSQSKVAHGSSLSQLLSNHGFLATSTERKKEYCSDDDDSYNDGGAWFNHS